MTTGLFIGRFQPFHKGHLAIIKNVEVDKLLIVIGSAQESRTKQNPLNADERESIIRETLKDEGISNFKIFKLADIPEDDKYVAYVEDHLPKFEVVYCGENKLVNVLFSKKYPVVACERLNDWIGTEVRRRIRNGEDYSDLVPDKVSELLDKLTDKF